MRAVLYTCMACASPQEVETERAECERIARATGQDIAGHIHDRSPDRSCLVRLLDTAGHEGIDALVATSLDPARLQQIIEDLAQGGPDHHAAPQPRLRLPTNPRRTPGPMGLRRWERQR